MAGPLGGSLSGIAARIAAVPGMERWIGPDDGAVVAQSLSLAAPSSGPIQRSMPGTAAMRAAMPERVLERVWPSGPAISSRRRCRWSPTRQRC